MVHAKLYFENGKVVCISLATRPLVGEYVIYENDRYRVKDVSHVAAPHDAGEDAFIAIKLGIGRKGSHRHMLEQSPRGFFTGTD
jgi:hypothetical protein